MDISYLFTRNYWIETTGSEFDFGFFSALALVAVIIVILLLLLLAFWLIFRCHRVREISVPQKDGEVVVAGDAISQAVVEALAKSSVFTLRKLRIHRCRKQYAISLYCQMRGSNNMEKVIPETKKLVLDTLKNNFSICNISRVRIIIEKLSQVYMPESAPEAIPVAEKPESVKDEEKADPGVE